MEEILGYISNYFAITKEEANFNITDNAIGVRGKYLAGQYIKLEGSILNDGIYRVESIAENTITVIGAINEVFKGTIYGLAIPKEIVNIAIKFEELKESAKNGIYEAESFGDYSYTLAKDSKGQVYTPIEAFKKELKQYRQMRDTSLNRAKVIL